MSRMIYDSRLVEILQEARAHVAEDHVCCPNKVKAQLDKAFVILKEKAKRDNFIA